MMPVSRLYVRCQSCFISLVCLLLVAALAHADDKSTSVSQQAPVQTMPSLAPVLKGLLPAIVNIKTLRTRVASSDNNKRNPPGSTPRGQEQSISLASGVIVDAKRGIILTNDHVIRDAQEVSVTLSDGRQIMANLIGSDPESDIAVIHIESTNLTSIPIGRSQPLAVGDYVMAIGNPFGLSQSVTSGIVSALGRDDLGIEGYENFIQTDASINPGNSGGALVDIQGKLVGINTAIITPEGGNVGIGFAIPIDMAVSIMQQIVQFGEVRRGLLGVIAQPLTPELAEAFEFDSQERGAIISHIVANGLAEHAGLKAGDLVRAVNNKPINSAAKLRNTIGLIPIGQKFTLTIVRNGQSKTINMMMRDPKLIKSAAETAFPQLAGAEFGTYSGDMAGHGRVQGVKLLSIQAGSPITHFGFAPGDVIVSANRQAVTTPNELFKAAQKRHDLLLVHVFRGDGSYYVVLK